MTGDPHRFANELDSVAQGRLIERLERRVKDAVFARLFEKYARRLNIGSETRVLEVGCGTGALVRQLASREVVPARIVGVDQCRAFIEAAKGFAAKEGVGDHIEWHAGDAHDLDYADHAFDVVILHTVISHVTSPVHTLTELARVLSPDGTLAIFDGDYASMTFAHPDHALGRRIDQALVTASFNNPVIMRELPRLLPGLGLAIKEAWGDAVVEIGDGSYFLSFAETYAPYVIDGGSVPADQVNDWLAFQQQAVEEKSFFASCTYYTYLVGAV